MTEEKGNLLEHYKISSAEMVRFIGGTRGEDYTCKECGNGRWSLHNEAGLKASEPTLNGDSPILVYAHKGVEQQLAAATGMLSCTKCGETHFINLDTAIDWLTKNPAEAEPTTPGE